MIRLFRKTRHNLIEQNNFKKYLIYAIGEVLIVMIGILIALQINNWNENRKLKVKEFKILNELHTDLIHNMSDIQININTYDQSIRSNEIIKYHIENQLPYNDSLNYHFSHLSAYVNFIMNQPTYDNLKQIGMDIISNDSLRFSISDLYGYELVGYKKFEDQYLLEHYVNNLKPILISKFSTFDNSSLEPKDYNQLMIHPQLKQVINYSITMYTNFTNIQSGLLNRIEVLIGEVEKEIEKLK